ncbi:isoprenylcysteine carboxylmethyltransferase family protein [Fodinibius sp.]|uniref:methyltransferase family protein n=1 Tax=Fodinibius sp. TaxID=1872440 RepID=UPI002ACDD49C|nr:isoprenylcysteine carboxylmethyltransferase family protein [Fodinibius sp.]MDZ7658303.1 isoprenylcysteine carboxylmethyltransferase family protein [Fodinibius sp.]
MKLELKIPPAIVTLIIAIAMWWIDQTLEYTWATFDTVLMIEFLFLGIGGFLGLAGLIQFYQSSTSIDPHKPGKTSRLVADGIYSISRNPMYLGLLFILAGYGFYLSNILTFLLLPLFVGYMNRYQIIPEEKVMEEKFGDDYLRYKSEVRRWL